MSVPFKMKGHTLPGINQRSEGNTDLPDGRSGSSAFQYKESPAKQSSEFGEDTKRAKNLRKYARKTFGRGSAEHAMTKADVSKAKGEDLAGAKGGKKATVFGNLRRKLNVKRTERLEKRAIKKGKEKEGKEDKSIKTEK